MKAYKITILWNYMQPKIDEGYTYPSLHFQQKRIVYRCDFAPPYDCLMNLMHEYKIDNFRIELWTPVDDKKSHKILKFENGQYQFSLKFEPGV